MTIPKEIKNILQQLQKNGFEGFIVGGCVRDLISGQKPKDWDITTNARPEEIQKIFPDSFYENEFGTVGVKTGSEQAGLEVVEITTYRTESSYSDRRHPDRISFASTLEEDLRRRDFAINALAMDIDGKVIDPFGGQKDLKNKIVRAVGEPTERFAEDALRLIRAIRFATTLGFEIEPATWQAIKERASLLVKISAERIRDEFNKIIETDQASPAQGREGTSRTKQDAEHARSFVRDTQRASASYGASRGVEQLKETSLLQYIIPELLEGVGVGQNLHHIYTVWEHNLRALQYACDQKYSLAVRLASLLHDVGKPRSKRGEGKYSTFYGHEVIGARMTAKVLARLKFPSELADKITKLVRWHLFYYNPGEVTESSVRRLVANIGKENVEDLIKVREADRIGSGVPKAKPYKLRHLQFMIDKVARDPLSPKMLKINGNDLMSTLNLPPGPKIGLILTALMEEVLDDPSKNDRGRLLKRSEELNQLTEEDLQKLARAGKEKVSEEEQKEIKKIKEKYYVK